MSEKNSSITNKSALHRNSCGHLQCHIEDRSAPRKLEEDTLARPRVLAFFPLGCNWDTC
jgi:hypothetical protein